MKAVIVSLSGGKDSTAMLLRMLELGERVDDIVFFDTGWEFPGMYDHLDLLENRTGRAITRLKPRIPFDYRLIFHPVRSKKDRPEHNIVKGRVYRYGSGWPSSLRRWCTREKINTIERYLKRQYALKNIIMCVGFASDESGRETSTMQSKVYNYRYPLIEWSWPESKCLEYCRYLGYDWGGLYEHFRRVSCYCCPLQRIGELRQLRSHHPGLWQKMLKMDRKIPNNVGFRNYDTVVDLEERFALEESQLEFSFS